MALRGGRPICIEIKLCDGEPSTTAILFNEESNKLAESVCVCVGVWVCLCVCVCVCVGCVFVFAPGGRSGG